MPKPGTASQASARIEIGEFTFTPDVVPAVLVGDTIYEAIE
jgi:hypothetical protein